MNTNTIKNLLHDARQAARQALASTSNCPQTLQSIARRIERDRHAILEANAIDLAAMPSSNPKYDRLLLNEKRIRAMADGIAAVAAMPAPPFNEPVSVDRRPNGIYIYKEKVPFGVIAIIYEARPNVTADVFALCMKSANVCLLKGGKEAYNTNKALVDIIRNELDNRHENPNMCILLPPDREAADELLQATDYVDLIIPRGGKDLISYVRRNSLVPVIETGAGVCHIYFDKDGDIEKGREIIYNAKTRRVSVCNALDCLLIARERLPDLPSLCAKLSQKNVLIYADGEAYPALKAHYPPHLLRQASNEHFGTEFLDYKMSIRTMSDGVKSAIDHISEYGSRHSEGIISNNPATIETFTRSIDAACLYANASISFTDGAEFGMGAEIGISTQKLHARGPMGINELLTYKYIIKGDGQTRPE